MCLFYILFHKGNLLPSIIKYITSTYYEDNYENNLRHSFNILFGFPLLLCIFRILLFVLVFPHETPNYYIENQ